MTLTTLIENIKTVFEQYARSVYADDAAMVWNNQDVKYHSVAFDLRSSRDYEGNTYHTFRFYAGDLLNDGHSNRNSIYNHLYNVLSEGFDELQDVDGIIEVQDNRTYQYAPVRMADVLAVAQVDVTFVVVSETCDGRENQLETDTLPEPETGDDTNP